MDKQAMVLSPMEATWLVMQGMIEKAGATFRLCIDVSWEDVMRALEAMPHAPAQ